MSTARATIVGAGVAGLSLGTALARRGWAVELIDGSGGSRTRTWGVIPATAGRRLPAACCRDESLPFDLILPGDHRVETRGRVTLVDLGDLRETWRREAVEAGISLRTARVAGPLRVDGSVAGVRTEAGAEVIAPLTIDASGAGVLLPSLPGTSLPSGRWPRRAREPWASARLRVDPREAQTAWVGRAQLRLDLQGPGALAWRCAPRDGTAVWAAATAGRGTTRSAAREVLARAVAPLELERDGVEIIWRPQRRPLDSLATGGLLVFGASAAWNDALMGFDLPPLQRAVELIALGLEPVRRGVAPGPAALHAVGAALLRGPGAVLAQRAAARRLLDRLGPGGREGLVASGAASPRAWAAALDGGGLLGIAGAARAGVGRLPRPWRRLVWSEVARAARLRAHAATYPRRFEWFEIDRWQARQQDIFRGT